MKLKNLIIGFVLLFNLIGNLSILFPTISPRIEPLDSINNIDLLADLEPFLQFQMNTRILPYSISRKLETDSASSVTSEHNALSWKPLSRSVYTIYFWSTDGRCRKHMGVAIHANSLLSSNHFLPSQLTSEDVQRIEIINAYGDAHVIDHPEEFSIMPFNSYTLIVFKENFLQAENIAALGDVADLKAGDEAYQAVVKGAPEGLYPTQIAGNLTIQADEQHEYSALMVSTDKTSVGDSGSPLYVQGVVYGINNSGNGLYGMITDPAQIYLTIQQISSTLAQQSEKCNTAEKIGLQ